MLECGVLEGRFRALSQCLLLSCCIQIFKLTNRERLWDWQVLPVARPGALPADNLPAQVDSLNAFRE